MILLPAINKPKPLNNMDCLFERINTLQLQGIFSENEAEMLKVAICELSATDAADLPDSVGTDGRNLIEHASDACDDAGIEFDEPDVDNEPIGFSD